jgi:hypothetical protein
MMSNKNYNINTLKGMTNYDDVDVCQTLGFPERIAYTPQIIQAQLDRDVDPNLHAREIKELKQYLTAEEYKQLV